MTQTTRWLVLTRAIGTTQVSSLGGLTRQEVVVTGRYEADYFYRGFKRQSKRRRHLKLNQVIRSRLSKERLLLLILRVKVPVTKFNLEIIPLANARIFQKNSGKELCKHIIWTMHNI